MVGKSFDTRLFPEIVYIYIFIYISRQCYYKLYIVSGERKSEENKPGHNPANERRACKYNNIRRSDLRHVVPPPSV